jgi:hypothetical protein
MLENGSRGVAKKQLIAGAPARSHDEQVVAGLAEMGERYGVRVRTAVHADVAPNQLR